MRYWLLTVSLALFAACDGPTPPLNGEEEGEPKTPLAEVGEILAGEKAPEEPGPVEPVPVEPVNGGAPVAKPVPDKPGFVISPYNGKWIDVTGVAPGELMLDPHFPAEEKKYFRVPEPPKPVAPVEVPPTPPAPPVEEATSPGAPE